MSERKPAVIWGLHGEKLGYSMGSEWSMVVIVLFLQTVCEHSKCSNLNKRLKLTHASFKRA